MIALPFVSNLASQHLLETMTINLANIAYLLESLIFSMISTPDILILTSGNDEQVFKPPTRQQRRKGTGFTDPSINLSTTNRNLSRLMIGITSDTFC